MSITLAPDLEKRIQEKVAAGLASSVQEFVEGAVRNALLPDVSRQPGNGRRSAAELFDEVWRDAREEALERLPRDGADQVDHYVYGTPKRRS